MKKYLLVGGLAVLLVVGGGAGWFVYRRGGDPLQNGRAAMERGDLRAAQIELRNAVRQNPRSAEAHGRLALTQLSLGDPVAAEKEIVAARDLGYDQEVVVQALGRSLLAQRRWQEALDTVPPAAGTPENTAVHLVLRSLAFQGLNDVPASRAALIEAERTDPKNVDARLGLAQLALVGREFPLAEQKADEALALDPKRPDSWLLKGQIRSAQGDRPGAIENMGKAVDLSPNVAVFRLERANQYVFAGDDAKAVADADAVLAREPRNFSALFMRMVLQVRAGKFVEAEALRQRLGATLQAFPRGLYFEAMIQAGLGQVEQAADAATRYVARVPNDPDGIRLLARTEMAARRPARAVAALTRAVGAGQSDPETLDLLGRAYAADNKPAQAAQMFERVAALAPQNAGVLARLASTRLQMGDLTGAQTDLQRSVELSPTQPGANEGLVMTALAAGDADRAQAALDKLRQQAGDTEMVGILTGLVHLARQDADGARAAFEATLKQFPQSAGAKLNLARTLAVLNRNQEAIAILNGLLATNRADPSAMATLIPLLITEQKVPEALTALEAAQTAAPDNTGFAIVRSDLLVQSGDAPRAVAMLEGLRNSGQRQPPLMLALARAQVAAGKLEDAKATLGQVVATSPGDLAARRALVELLVRMRDFAAASTTLREGLVALPGNSGLMAALVNVAQQESGSLDAALAAATELRRNPANMPAAALLKGGILMLNRRFADAAAAYKAEYDAAPGSALAIRTAGALLASGAPDQARQFLLAWQAKEPRDADAAAMLGAMALTGRRYDEAEKNLSLAIEIRPDDAASLNNLAWLYQAKGDPRALAMAQRAYAVASSPETTDTLGYVLTKQGQAARAVPLLRRAVQQRPGNPAVRFHLAEALNATGEKEEAVRLLQALVAEPAEFEEKAAARELLRQLRPG